MKSDTANGANQKKPAGRSLLVAKAQEAAARREAKEARGAPGSGAGWLFISGVFFCLLLFFCAHCALRVSEVGWETFALTTAARRGVEIVATETFLGFECLQKGFRVLSAERVYKQEHPEREGETITEILEREEGLAECRRAAAREKGHDWVRALLVAALFAVQAGVWAAIFSSSDYIPPYYPALAVASLVTSAGVVVWLFWIASRKSGQLHG